MSTLSTTLPVTAACCGKQRKKPVIHDLSGSCRELRYNIESADVFIIFIALKLIVFLENHGSKRGWFVNEKSVFLTKPNKVYGRAANSIKGENKSHGI